MKLSLKGENQNPKYAFVIYLVWLHELHLKKKKKKKNSNASIKSILPLTQKFGGQGFCLFIFGS